MVTADDLTKIRKKYPQRITRSQSIKLYCKHNCCAGDLVSWKECEQKGCFLWSWRKGKEIVDKEKTQKKTRVKSAVLEQQQLNLKRYEVSK